MIHEAVGGSGLGHIAVALDTRDFGAEVRRVPEFDEGFGGEAVDPLLGDLALARGEGGQFADFRLGGGDLGVTEHALAQRGKGGRGGGVG